MVAVRRIITENAAIVFLTLVVIYEGEVVTNNLPRRILPYFLSHRPVPEAICGIDHLFRFSIGGCTFPPQIYPYHSCEQTGHGCRGIRISIEWKAFATP